MKRAKYRRLNAAQCLKCWSVLVSYHVHDFVTCKCDSLAVDGGFDYYKRSYKDKKDYKEMDIYEKVKG